MMCNGSNRNEISVMDMRSDTPAVSRCSPRRIHVSTGMNENRAGSLVDKGGRIAKLDKMHKINKKYSLGKLVADPNTLYLGNHTCVPVGGRQCPRTLMLCSFSDNTLFDN